MNLGMGISIGSGRFRGTPAAPVVREAMTAAHRTSGVAPLAVFFDPIDDGAEIKGITQPADGDPAQMLYAWNYGDDTGETWEHSGKSKNQDLGFLGAHVYETPGTYTATLWQMDENGTIREYEQTITVQSPQEAGWRTYYVSSDTDGSDANDGLTEATPFATIPKAFTTAGTAGGVHIRLKRGSTFSIAVRTDTNIGVGSLIDAYGTGDKPVIDFPSSQGFRTTNNDCRWVDVRVTGRTANASCFEVTRSVSTGYDKLFLRVEAANTQSNWSWPYGGNSRSSTFLVDCLSTGFTYSGVFGGGKHIAVLGGTFGPGATGRHGVRLHEQNRNLVAHIGLTTPGDQDALKIHSLDYPTHSVVGQYVNIRDNRLECSGSAYGAWVGPEDGTSDERIRYAIVESNYVYALSGSMQAGIILSCSDSVARNNIVDTTGYASPRAIEVVQRGIEPAPDKVRVYNNTLVTRTSGTNWTGVKVVNGTAIEVGNNLCEAPAQSISRVAVSNSIGAELTEGTNLLTLAAGVVDAANGDYHLTAGSAAIGAGTASAYVRRDYDGVTRGTPPDLGALEYA